jgi:hypothetical protein
MATMVEVLQRMLTNRPTVARISETDVWLVGRSPTRARDPRTEITRPKDVTVVEPGIRDGVRTVTMPAVIAQRVKPAKRPVRQIPVVSAVFFSRCRERLAKLEKIEDLHRSRAAVGCLILRLPSGKGSCAAANARRLEQPQRVRRFYHPD